MSLGSYPLDVIWYVGMLVTFLGPGAILTGESVVFLIGSIIGYSFAFLKGGLALGTP